MSSNLTGPIHIKSVKVMARQYGKTMHADDVISSIGSIYKRFFIPTVLELHMMRVAAVGTLICNNWTGSEIRKNNIIAVLLIHDLGNIVKFDLDSRDKRKLFLEEKDLDYWRKIKAEVMTKYGSEEHEATSNMARELGIDKDMQELLDGMSRYEGDRKGMSNEEYTEVCICAYADLRVAPFGVVSASERVQDLIYRYTGRSNEAVFKELLETSPKLENYIFKHVSITPGKITEESTAPIVAKFRK